MLFDTHCHLDAAEFAPDRAAVVERARAAGVAPMLVPAVSAETFADTIATAREFDCLLALGIHPLYLPDCLETSLALLREAIEREKPCAVGEIGLDFFVSDLDPARQTELLVAQLQLAREFDLPVLLHLRRAQDAVLKALREVGVTRGIAHAFNGSRQQAEGFIRQGFKLGFGGAMTWPRALNLQRLAADLPLEAIVLETDSPDMPSAWRAGQRNEPAELARIAQVLAGLRGITVEEVAAATSANARAVLGL